MRKYEYNIHNLDCAHCAKRIEDGLNKKEDFKNVLVNFNTCKLSFASNKEFSLKEMNEEVKKIDADAYLTKDEKDETKNGYHLSILIIGTVLGLLAYFIELPDIIKYILYGISYLLLLHRTIINAAKLLIKGKTIDENLLIMISCIGALLIGEPLEGMMVIILYSIGKILEGKALNNSRKSIKDLMNLKEPYANLKKGHDIITIKVEDVKVKDILVIKKGEKIPVDGKIIKGETHLDTSSLTGEAKPLMVKVGDNVLSGSINNSDIIEIEAINTYENSAVAKILELLDSATNKKAKTETIISKVSKYYTPIILLLAILVVIVLPLFDVPFKDSLYRGLTFLVVSCPCAIAISVPLSYFTGIGASSKHGILIKGSNYLDNLSNAKNIIFDKTGTLTTGSFEVSDIIIEDKNYSKEDIINILCLGESLSNHPIAKSILKLSTNKIDNQNVKKYKEIEGLGICFTINKKKVKIGSSTFCECASDEFIHLNIDNKHVATIILDDGIKEKAKETICTLKKDNIKTWMFTGDKRKNAIKIGKELNIDEIKYEMLPQDKFKAFEDVQKSGLTIFVGDGVNDAPVLKRSDIGISMGGVGADSSIEASDIVIMQDDLDNIPLAIDISKYTKYIINQNLILAILTKLIVLILSTIGLANMWLAVFADTGVTLLTILNTLRILRKYSK